MGVLGIGGIFFRAQDPDALSKWYKDHLHVGAGCSGDGGDDPSDWFWRVQAGPVVFAPFKATTDYFPADKQHMLNLRVDGIDDMIASLTAAGIAVETRAEWDAPETGRFARIHDPEGNPIELWQPPA
ncbi:VOC family protein [Sphingomonas crocodyli]|uniref:VOC family protein n=1 Tax=Sphingomonas crocodyli TaxID=1979270 RepID=A0A437M500_9SPHN|nr:VOC family protein [Sphingomonas crocodyli]RVT92666.1 VOC family protein [Sphingomonas crocodyli]